MTEGDDRRGNFSATSDLQPLTRACKPRPKVLLGIKHIWWTKQGVVMEFKKLKNYKTSHIKTPKTNHQMISTKLYCIRDPRDRRVFAVRPDASRLKQAGVADVGRSMLVTFESHSDAFEVGRALEEMVVNRAELPMPDELSQVRWPKTKRVELGLLRVEPMHALYASMLCDSYALDLAVCHNLRWVGTRAKRLALDLRPQDASVNNFDAFRRTLELIHGLEYNAKKR